jgi:acyl-[acyl-carrier-protein]-phospholipid O-acyltransferase/long-chain-fatty-acid--[acyl-carrier-protein] ligase
MPIRRPVRILFGQALRGGAATTEQMQDAVTRLEHEAFAGRSELGENLGFRTLKALKKKVFALRLVDRGLGALKVRGIALLGLGLGFSRLIKKSDTAHRVGILLPPGLPGFAANLGALWAGKSSVNLNPTVSAARCFYLKRLFAWFLTMSFMGRSG